MPEPTAEFIAQIAVTDAAGTKRVVKQSAAYATYIEGLESLLVWTEGLMRGW